MLSELLSDSIRTLRSRPSRSASTTASAARWLRDTERGFSSAKFKSPGIARGSFGEIRRIGALSSHRLLPLHRHPRAGAGVRPVIPHRAVLGAAVVPERDGVFAPAEAALEQRIFSVLVEIGQHRIALVAGHADQKARKAAVDVKRLLAGHRMGAHDRV